MPVLTTRDSDAAALLELLDRNAGLLVVCLCAAWCDACREFGKTFERLAARQRNAGLVWLDIEDDSALVGDIEIENFPTLAVYRSGEPVFFGVTLPQEGTIARILGSLDTPEARVLAVPREIAALPAALAERARAVASVHTRERG
jgi:thioredoxin 1